MSKITVGQLCELFGQIAEEKITGEVIQEVIENAEKIGLSRLFKKIIKQACKIADLISNADLKVKALASIAANGAF